VAYKLDLPAESRIHPVFHVSCLKKKLGQHSTPLPTLPPIDANGELRSEPEAIMDKRMIKHRGRALTKALIQWKGASVDQEYTWENLLKLQAQYPHLVGKVL
jgi:hypothetical protein